MLIDTASDKPAQEPPRPIGPVAYTVLRAATFLLILAYLAGAAGLLIKACKWALAQW